MQGLPRPLASQRHGWISADVGAHAELIAQVSAAGNAHAFQILINNTAGPAPGAIAAASAEQFLDTFNRHLIANHLLVQAVLAGMRGAGYGRIINVISTSVKEPLRNLGVSNTIRGAVASWSKTLARELTAFGITVNNVLPGYTRTQRLEQIIRDRVAASGQSGDAVRPACWPRCRPDDLQKPKKSPPRLHFSPRLRPAISMASICPWMADARSPCNANAGISGIQCHHDRASVELH